MSQILIPTPEDIALLMSLAEQGDKTYQFAVGIIYGEGHGVPIDEEEAVTWFTKAAKQGHLDAQFNVGMAYFMSKGTFKNHMKALHWFTLAAEQGDTESYFKLGVLFSKGDDGVPFNLSTAAKFFEIALTNGHPEAKTNLDLIYSSDVLDGEPSCNTH